MENDNQPTAYEQLTEHSKIIEELACVCLDGWDRERRESERDLVSPSQLTLLIIQNTTCKTALVTECIRSIEGTEWLCVCERERER